MTVGRPIRTKKGTRGREVGDNCSFVFHFWHWSWSICSPSCTMRQQNSKLVAVPWLCVICAGGSCLICLMWVVAVVAQDVSKQVTRDGHPSKLMIETYWNPKVSNWVSGIFALYCGSLTDLKPEIMVLYCRLQQEDYMVNKTFRNAFCMRRPDDRAYPKWWPCRSLRGQFWWTVQHSTSGWRGVIHEVSAGTTHVVLLRSDGRAVACGSNAQGQCNIPPLEQVISRVDADMDRVHAWLVFVQRTIWELRHGS